MLSIHPSPRWGMLLLVGAVVWGFGIESALAQSMFGTGAPTNSGGSSGLVRSTSNQTGFSSTFGGTNQASTSTSLLSSLTQGSSSLNTSGQAATSGTALTGPQISTQLGQLSATVGQGGFVGRSDTAGRFVGNAMTGQQGIQGTNVGRGNQNNNYTSQQNNFNNQQTGMLSQRIVRPRLSIAFDYNARPPVNVQTNLSTEFQRLQTDRPSLQGVQVQMGGDRRAILRGSVPSENDRKLAAMLARMEPGVRSVVNELTIAAE